MIFDDEIAIGVREGVEKSPGNPNRWRQLMLLAFDQKDQASFRTLQMISSGIDRMVEAERRAAGEAVSPTDSTLLTNPPEARLSRNEYATFIRLAADPNDSNALKEVSRLYLGGRRLPDVARQHLERALELCPNDREIRDLIQEASTAASAQMSEATHAVVAQRDTSEIPDVALPADEKDDTFGLSKALPAENTQTTRHANPAATIAELRDHNRGKGTLQTANLDDLSRRVTATQSEGNAADPTETPETNGHGNGEESLSNSLIVSDETRKFIHAASPLQLIKRSMDLARDGRFDEAATICRMALRRQPDLELAWEAWATLGLACFEHGHLAEAIDAYEQALTHDESALETWFNLGVAYVHDGRREDALRCYLRALALAPDNPKINCNLGTVYFQNSHFEHAAQCFRQAVAAKPDYVRAWDNLAAALGAQQRYDEAAEACQQVLQLTPDHADALFKLGTIHYRKGEDATAAECIRRVLGIRPEDAQALAYQAMLAARTGDLETARTSVTQAADFDAEPTLIGSAWLAIGKACLERKRFSEAVEAFRQATDRRPNDFEPWQLLGQALRKAGNLADAEHAFFLAVQMNSKSLTAWRFLGLTRFDQQDYQGAAAAQQFATEVKPDDTGIWLELSASYQMMKMRDDAIDALQHALKADPASLPAVKSLCLTLIEAQRAPEAADAAGEAIVHHPDSAEMLTLLGRSLAAAGRHADAIPHLEKASELAEARAETWRALGDAYSATGDDSKASIALRKAIDLMH